MEANQHRGSVRKSTGFSSGSELYKPMAGGGAVVILAVGMLLLLIEVIWITL